ncbi:MAG TPA: hypothetical protein VKG38_10610 [Solirubrobacteraceae bacterium]|nr:hypothetical protein [Solirubrobacteraceae bacterium]
MAFHDGAGAAATCRQQSGRELPRTGVRRLLAVLFALGIGGLFGLVVDLCEPPSGPVALAAIAALLVFGRLVAAGLDRGRRGRLEKMRDRAIRDGLAARGWLTVHDGSRCGSELERVALGPGGLLRVKATSRDGEILASQLNEAWLRQARRQRGALERLVGERADRLLVLADGHIAWPAVSRRRRVLVVPARILTGQHARGLGPVYTPRALDAFHAQVVDALEMGAAGRARSSP